MGERPLHTRKVAGSIPAGTTYVVAVRIWYLVLQNKCDVISVLSGSVDRTHNLSAAHARQLARALIAAADELDWLAEGEGQR